jgi:GNAT superfamily N-acetyltransferase
MAFALRLMTAQDIPAGMRLKELAGWNQTESDWLRFLHFEPDGCLVALQDGAVCGTVATLRYGTPFGWISMILVDPASRNQGIGTRLLDEAIAYLGRMGVTTCKLDATPMSRSLYINKGFVDEFQIERWEGISRVRRGPGLPLISDSELSHVCAWDTPIFGADRERLLMALWEEGPQYSALAYAHDEIAGYILGRAGSRAHHLGPWVVAAKPEAAERLLLESLSRVRGQPVFVDICLESPHAREIVQSAGLRFQRKLTRMYRGPSRFPGKPSRIYGIAGPELG